MSRDIFVQDVPEGIRSVAEIPEDWVAGSLPCTSDEVRAAVLELCPTADFVDAKWGIVDLPGVSIEVNVGDDTPLDSFALHVRARDKEVADEFIRSLLDRLGVRAFDIDSESGIFGST